MTVSGEVILVEEDAVCFLQDDPCPRSWQALTPTADPGVRVCGRCGRTVHFCDNKQAALTHQDSEREVVAMPLFTGAATMAGRIRAA
jgi:polyferredoxin